MKQTPPPPDIFSATPLTADQAIGVTFGNELELVGLNLPPTVKRGEPLEIELVWKTDTAPTKDWTIAVHIDHQNPYRRLSADHNPPIPTSKWPAGQYVHWKKTVPIPATAETGEYLIEVYPYTSSPDPLLKGKMKFDKMPVTQKSATAKVKLTVTK